MYTYYILTILIITIITYEWLLHLTQKHSNLTKRNLCSEYYVNCIINIFIATSLYMLIVINVNNLHNINVPNIINIFSYLVIVDSCFYWIHRTIHRTPFLKKHLHMTHHTAHDVIPLDIYYTDVKEHILYSLFVGAVPLLFINVNLLEYALANIIILCHSIYTHSESGKKFILPLFIDSKYHKYHHQIGKGNYAVFFNIWDNYMGTRIKLKKRNIGQMIR